MTWRKSERPEVRSAIQTWTPWRVGRTRMAATALISRAAFSSGMSFLRATVVKPIATSSARMRSMKGSSERSEIKRTSCRPEGVGLVDDVVAEPDPDADADADADADDGLGAPDAARAVEAQTNARASVDEASERWTPITISQGSGEPPQHRVLGGNGASSARRRAPRQHDRPLVRAPRGDGRRHRPSTVRWVVR